MARLDQEAGQVGRLARRTAVEADRAGVVLISLTPRLSMDSDVISTCLGGGSCRLREMRPLGVIGTRPHGMLHHQDVTSCGDHSL